MTKFGNIEIKAGDVIEWRNKSFRRPEIIRFVVTQVNKKLTEPIQGVAIGDSRGYKCPHEIYFYEYQVPNFKKLSKSEWDNVVLPQTAYRNGLWITKYSEYRFTVESETDQTKEYEVIIRKDGSLSCTCPSFQYQTSCCKHIRAVELF